MENKKFKFNVGDRVICSQLAVPRINGKKGTIVAVGNFDGNEYLVEMDEACECLHRCRGFVPSGRGWMFFESSLSPAPAEEKESAVETGIFPLDKIKAGYLLKVHDETADIYFHMIVNFNATDNLACHSVEGDHWWSLHHFDDDLVQIGAHRMVVTAIYGRTVNSDLLNCDTLNRELLWERKEETKAKKMTVAEVCKALGYDIEIVKE